jgi:Holliday junction resolvase RusA-like endonuclease
MARRAIPRVGRELRAGLAAGVLPARRGAAWAAAEPDHGTGAPAAPGQARAALPGERESLLDQLLRAAREARVHRPTKEAEAFKEECGWRAKAAGVRVPFVGHVELRVRLIPENKICMDLDNALKVTVDALKGIVYADDDQVMRIVAERADADPVGGKRLEVEVSPYSMPIALEAAA